MRAGYSSGRVIRATKIEEGARLRKRPMLISPAEEPAEVNCMRILKRLRGLSGALAMFTTAWFSYCQAIADDNIGNGGNLESTWEKGCTEYNVCTVWTPHRFVFQGKNFILGRLGVGVTKRGEYYFFFAPACDVPTPSKVRIDNSVTLELHLKGDYPCLLLFAKLSDSERDAIIFGTSLTYDIKAPDQTFTFRVNLTNFPRDILGARKDWKHIDRHSYGALADGEEALVE